MEEIFTISQLMSQSNNTMKSGKYQQDKVMNFTYFEKKYRLIAVGLSKQKALDANSRAIQQNIFTGKIKATADNTKVISCYILEQSKETII